MSKADILTNPSNYEKLEANKNSVLKHAQEVLSSKPSVITPEDKSSMLNDAKIAVEHSNFSQAISKLDQLKDAKLNITWHESSDLGHGTKSLVRDARNVETEASRHDAEEKYAMQLLNEVRAAIKLLDTASLNIDKTQKDESKTQLQNIAKFVLNKIDHATQDDSVLNDKTVKEYNTYIVDILQKSGIDKPAEKLNFAKEISNFDDEHRHITTLTTAFDRQNKTHIVIESDIMLNGLTTKQEAIYKHIANTHPNKIIDPSISERDMKWYETMPPYKQEMLKGVAGEIAKGNKVIPTQLLSDVIGLRNGYQKITAISSEQEKPPIILGMKMHSGAPATKIKFDRINQTHATDDRFASGAERIGGQHSNAAEYRGSESTGKLLFVRDLHTQSNDPQGLDSTDQKQLQKQIVQGHIEQIQTYVAPGQKVNLHNLTSTTPWDIRGEDFIANQLKEIRKNYGQDTNLVELSASPINKWRVLGAGRDQEVFNTTLKQMGEDLYKYSENNKQLSDAEKLSLQDVASYLKDSSASPHKFAQKAIKVLGSSKNRELNSIAPLLEEAVASKNLIGHSDIFTNSENINLEIASRMGVIKNNLTNNKEINQEIFLTTKSTMAQDIDFCKSGKDRTGLLELETTHRLVSKHLGLETNSKKAQQNKLYLATGGHTQEMAGIQGGTIGCHSIKTNPEFALNQSDKQLNGIINQKSSSFNSKIKVVKEKYQKEISAKINKEITQNQVSDRKHVASSKKDQSVSKDKSVSSKIIAKARALGRSMKKHITSNKTQSKSSQSNHPTNSKDQNLSR